MFVYVGVWVHSSGHSLLNMIILKKLIYAVIQKFYALHSLFETIEIQQTI